MSYIRTLYTGACTAAQLQTRCCRGWDHVFRNCTLRIPNILISYLYICHIFAHSTRHMHHGTMAGEALQGMRSRPLKLHLDIFNILTSYIYVCHIFGHSTQAHAPQDNGGRSTAGDKIASFETAPYTYLIFWYPIYICHMFGHSAQAHEHMRRGTSCCDTLHICRILTPCNIYVICLDTLHRHMHRGTMAGEALRGMRSRLLKLHQYRVGGQFYYMETMQQVPIYYMQRTQVLRFETYCSGTGWQRPIGCPQV